MARPLNIKYTPVEHSKAEWANKKGIMARYEGLAKGTLDKMLMEMRDEKKFREYVVNPTYKTVFINLSGFHEFLVWRQTSY